MTTTESICTITTIYSTQLQPYMRMCVCMNIVQSDTTVSQCHACLLSFRFLRFMKHSSLLAVLQQVQVIGCDD